MTRSLKDKPEPIVTPSADRGLMALDKDGKIKPTYGNLCILLRADFPSRFSYNQMSTHKQLDGRALRDPDLGAIRERLERVHKVSFSRENIKEAVIQIAAENSFHPVRSYLESLTWDGVPRLSTIATKLMGATDIELHHEMIRCFFIGAVARAISPGWKHDTVLVLFGPMGYFKSSFFRVLGSPWYCGNHVPYHTRQGLLTWHANWINELPEIDQITCSKDMSEFNGICTTPEDDFVEPYGSANTKHPRSFIFGGTTNKQRYLTDVHGDRRFHTIEVKKKIDWNWIENNRDQLWAEAIDLYLEGKPNYLDDAGETERSNAAEIYRADDPWFDPVQEHVEAFYQRTDRMPEDFITTANILSKALGVPKERHERQHENRIGAILLRLGLVSVRPWVGAGATKRRLRAWDRPKQEEEEA